MLWRVNQPFLIDRASSILRIVRLSVPPYQRKALPLSSIEKHSNSGITEKNLDNFHLRVRKRVKVTTRNGWLSGSESLRRRNIGQAFEVVRMLEQVRVPNRITADLRTLRALLPIA